MLHNNCGASGYYTFDAEKANDAFFSCKPACFGCCCCCGGCVAVCTNNASSMAEYGIEKIGEFTNPESPLENRCSYDEQLQITLPPYQIDDECWIIFTQCYLPGTISCWNGCMKKYVSHDLITWCEPTGEIDDYYINTNEGDRSLITVDTTNSIINKKTDYFFNKECIGNQGLIEYNTSANQYERTGLVIGSGDKVWVADDSGNSDIPVQIWGYEE